MANVWTEFSVLLPVGEGNVETALALYADTCARARAEGKGVGFYAEKQDDANVWLHSGGDEGDVEGVVAYVLRCAEALDLQGPWGFCWAVTASRPVLDAFGGGAQMLDLSRRTSADWVDCDTWLQERTAPTATTPGPTPRAVRASALVRPVAASQEWTPATQGGVLLDFIDALIEDDPDVAERLGAHLAQIVADSGGTGGERVDPDVADTPDEPADPAAGDENTDRAKHEGMGRRGCGRSTSVARAGTSHDRGEESDGIDPPRDRDHTAIPDGDL